VQTNAPLSLRVIAVAMIVSAAALATLSGINLLARLRAPALHNLGRFWWFCVYLVTVGGGLYYARLWAAILAALPLAILGLSIITISIIRVPSPWFVAGVLLGSIFILPAYAIFSHRHYLK
jgi:hypothetical protein